MKKYLILLPIVIILFFQKGLVYSKNTVTYQPPNVVLILTDNQSYYELSCNGHSIVQTPNIDKFAEKAVVFDNFYTTPFCSPSRTELLTGKYSLRSGVHNTIGGVSNIAVSQTLLTGYLKKAGYKSAVFGKWHLGNEYPYNPLYRGFDKSFIHDGGGIGQLPDYYGNTHINAHFNNNGNIVPTIGFSTDVLFKEAKSFIKENKNNPFFCFISTPATHTPWQAHPQKLKELEKRGVKGKTNEMALYSMIENIDDNVGWILDFLDSHGLRENTFVIIATDQGMGYQGLNNPPPEKHFGLADNVFDNRHKVFCMMQYPKIINHPYQSSCLAGIIDIAPTILDICGIQVPPEMDGKSLKPLLSGESKKNWDANRTLIVQCPRQRERIKNQLVSVKTKKWRLINGKLLFDAKKDPFQLKDVSELYPLVVDSLNEIYNVFWNSLPPENEILPTRFYIGAKEAPETRLNAMDWYKGDAPWTQNEILKKNKQGVWAINICRTGRYVFELRRFPREAPHPIEATKAAIKINNITQKKSISKSDSEAIFEVMLKEGKYDFQTIFKDDESQDENKQWGAYFVYINLGE